MKQTSKDWTTVDVGYFLGSLCSRRVKCVSNTTKHSVKATTLQALCSNVDQNEDEPEKQDNGGNTNNIGGNRADGRCNKNGAGGGSVVAFVQYLRLGLSIYCCPLSLSGMEFINTPGNFVRIKEIRIYTNYGRRTDGR